MIKEISLLHGFRKICHTFVCDQLIKGNGKVLINYFLICHILGKAIQFDHYFKL